MVQGLNGHFAPSPPPLLPLKGALGASMVQTQGEGGKGAQTTGFQVYSQS